jgi:hypothetical protein
MDNRKWQANASGTPPSVPSSPSVGYPTNGGVSTPVTTPGEWWYHQIGEELRTVVTASLQTPTHNRVDQLLEALTAGWGMGKSLTAIGYITLPGGFIMQWGLLNSSDLTTTFPITFPTGMVKGFMFANQNDANTVIGNRTFISANTNAGLTRSASGISANYLVFGN